MNDVLLRQNRYSLSLFFQKEQKHLVLVFTHSDFKMALSFAIMGSIAATALKFINNVKTYENMNFNFECQKIDQLALNLEYNSKIAMEEFIFHCTINSRTNLKRKFTQIW